MKLKAVIFDWAGTMVDFGSLAPVLAMRDVFAAEGVALEDHEIRAGMGLAKRDHVAELFALARVQMAWLSSKGSHATITDEERLFTALEPAMAAAGLARATLIPGAAHAASALRTAGVRIGSTTGYTREMLKPILQRAAELGYSPDVAVCAGEAMRGRPAPFMIWRALEVLDVWPARDDVVKVDDAPVGIQEGKNAGCFTIGVAASGNGMGLDLSTYQALPEAVRRAKLHMAREELVAAGADLVIDSVADLCPALSARGMM